MLDTSLKAIHNVRCIAGHRSKMSMPYARYKFESNSQQQVAQTVLLGDVYAIC